MQRASTWLLNVLAVAGVFVAAPAYCDDADALALQAELPVEPVRVAQLRAAVEVGIGRIDSRGGLSARDGHRASLDLRYSTPLSSGWRLSLSDRLDDTHPAPDGQPSTVNSLREANLSWQESTGAASAELGRINVRHGPAYGYNPTDYFRAGALRTVTTADPVTLREIRMGTVMLRGSYLWSGGGVSLALAPKLESGPDTRSSAVDLGATNSADRALLTVSSSVGERFSGQGLLLIERGASPQLGANFTALAGRALVVHAEWSSGKSTSLLEQIVGSPTERVRRQRAAAGLTYTFPNALAVTVEAEHNGAGLNRAEWETTMNQGVAAYRRYVALTQLSQEIGSRRAWLIYASQKNMGLKQLDLTAFVRVNPVDHSRLTWAELRYHWPRFDAALQWQRSSGDARSEFGSMPYRQVTQLVGVLYL
jgi:hypothetical protein